MRAAVLILACLALAKVWAHFEFHRQATEEALIAAYRERAIAACQTVSRAEPGGRKAAALPEAGPWGKPEAIQLIIGKPGLDVAIWDTENALWPVRYKYPFLVLSPADTGLKDRCAFDVTLGEARLRRE